MGRVRTSAVDPGPSLVQPTEAPARLVPAWWRTAAVVLLLVSLVLGTLAALATWGAVATPSEESAEVGFSRDMVQHHQQAVTMAFLVRDRTDDPEVRALAMDLVTAQSEEQGMLTAWLRRHEVPASSAVPQMSWMAGAAAVTEGHDAGADDGAEHDDRAEHDDGAGTTAAAAPMTMADMGLATDGELARLARLEGRAAEVSFLQLMREHHTGGTTMIQAYLELGSDDELRRIAEGMLTAQTREIRIIDELLEARGERA